MGSRALRALLSAWLTKLPWTHLFDCRFDYTLADLFCKASPRTEARPEKTWPLLSMPPHQVRHNISHDESQVLRCPLHVQE
jgi:hypothetical protein